MYTFERNYYKQHSSPLKASIFCATPWQAKLERWFTMLAGQLSPGREKPQGE